MANNSINSNPKSYAALRFLGPVMAGVIGANIYGNDIEKLPHTIQNPLALTLNSILYKFHRFL
jgi:hypothetical protein